jgi:mono/diheme cytochrome c family protein
MKMVPITALLCGASMFAQADSNPSPSSGKQMFRAYCAPCHGIEGKGDGPAASAFRTPPPDLTKLAKKNGGKFPGAAVAHELSDVYEAPHGSKEMPVWGPILSEISPKSEALGALRIANLVKYIETLQEK